MCDAKLTSTSLYKPCLAQKAMLREELDNTRARIAEADHGRSAAEHTAAGLGLQVEDLRACAANAEAARVKVSPELLT